jgi:hypothetical protein
MLRALDTYDWPEAFDEGTANISGALPGDGYDLTPFSIEDVVLILWMDEGENDGPDWIIAGVLQDNRGFFLSAGCDYTGWDCQAGGHAVICNSIEELLLFGIDDGDKDRFGIHMLGHENPIGGDVYDVD